MFIRPPAAVLAVNLVAVAGVAVVLGALPALAFDDEFKVLEGGVWDISGGAIPYALEPNGSDDVDGGADLEALRTSFRAWACVEGTGIRFTEDDAPGPADLDFGDGVNTLFWDEVGNICNMGGGTLGITTGEPGGGSRTQGDICFNGRDHEWGVGTRTDIQSIAMHEIGHFIGLDHPCDNDDDASTCLSPGDSVMFPSWSGVNEREPLSSDVAAVRFLYPVDEDLPTGCNGPFGPGEKCDCDGDCVDGLLCVPDGEQVLRCGRACASDDADCGAGSTCVVDKPQDDGVAPGVCVAFKDAKPGGAICVSGSECASGTCTTNVSIGRSLCFAICGTDADCAGGSCFEGQCLGGFDSVACEEPDEPEVCGCVTIPGASASSSAAGGAAPGVVVAGVVAALVGLRRRRRHRTRPEGCA